MKPYLEPRFLGVLILESRRATIAQEQIQRFQAPYFVTALSAIQIEHLLLWGPQNTPLRAASQRGQTNWDYWFAEGTFQIEASDWDSAFRLARAMMRQAQRLEESWLTYLHGALAAGSGATHYLSFQPAYRRVAKTFGLKILPERL
jgi:hypothetical protein